MHESPETPLTDPNPLLLRITEACLLLAVGRSTIYSLMARGELETVHLGRSARITRSSAEAFIERRRATSVSSGRPVA